MKLFSKDIEPRCEYCRKAIVFDGCDEIGCRRRGIVSPDDKCRRFVYDPLKRVPDPPRSYKEKEFDAEDFTL